MARHPEIDWIAVLKRLIAFAVKQISIGSEQVSMGRVVGGLGLSIEDIATEVVNRAALEYEREGGETFASEDDAVNALIPRVYHRFLDRTRRKEDGASIMVWERERAIEDGHSFAGTSDTAATVSWHMFCASLHAEAATLQNPQVLRYVALQCEPDGFMGYSRAEVAKLLDITPDEVTNIQKAVQRLLVRTRLLN